MLKLFLQKMRYCQGLFVGTTDIWSIDMPGLFPLMKNMIAVDTRQFIF